RELDHETRPSDLQLPQSAGASVQIKGGLQFTPSTWKEFGGRKYAPSAEQATKAQQIEIAKKVQDEQGWKAWPACTEKLGWR
ncbi:transglycosylase family protein, partial [Pseudonocardia sp. EV170527-09]|uniref:transglycosylase family protein n=1 Tax=Pseudonocardia sp. EV170527-09 TaxID=2603411 RepID=UPI0011F25C42